MGLFSEELLELDRNTVKYMIDEMQEEIDASKKVIEEQGQIKLCKNNGRVPIPCRCFAYII